METTSPQPGQRAFLPASSSRTRKRLPQRQSTSIAMPASCRLIKRRNCGHYTLGRFPLLVGIRSQRSEARDQRSESRGRSPEFRSQRHSGPNGEMARSGKKRDSLAFSAPPPHRGPNREMASCGAFSGKSADFGRSCGALWCFLEEKWRFGVRTRSGFTAAGNTESLEKSKPRSPCESCHFRKPIASPPIPE
jgi:hypothetical protein